MKRILVLAALLLGCGLVVVLGLWLVSWENRVKQRPCTHAIAAAQVAVNSKSGFTQAMINTALEEALEICLNFDPENR